MQGEAAMRQEMKVKLFQLLCSLAKSRRLEWKISRWLWAVRFPHCVPSTDGAAFIPPASPEKSIELRATECQGHHKSSITFIDGHILESRSNVCQKSKGFSAPVSTLLDHEKALYLFLENKKPPTSQFLPGDPQQFILHSLLPFQEPLQNDWTRRTTNQSKSLYRPESTPLTCREESCPELPPGIFSLKDTSHCGSVNHGDRH